MMRCYVVALLWCGVVGVHCSVQKTYVVACLVARLFVRVFGWLIGCLCVGCVVLLF